MNNKLFLIGANTLGLEFAEADLDNVANEMSKFGYIPTKPKPKKEDVIKAFDDFIDTSSQSDNLIVYLSGHALPQNNKLFFLIRDDFNQQKNIINVNNQILEPLSASRASNKLVILDCCHANFSIPVDWNINPTDKFYLFTASDRIQKAKEFTWLNGSFLSTKICEYLRDHSTAEVLLEDLYQWVKDSAHTHNKAKSLNTAEVPIPNLLSNHKTRFVLGYSAKSSIQGKLNNFKAPTVLLPPRKKYSKLYGRELELVQLRDWILRDESSICVCGMHGTGKRSLILEFIEKCTSGEIQLDKFPLDTIVYLAAEIASENKWGFGKKPSLSSVGDIHSQIAIALDINEELRSLPKEQHGGVIKRELNKNNTLLIIENYSALEDKSISIFLSELPEKTKCIIVDNHQHFYMNRVAIYDLDKPSSIQLLETLCTAKNINLSDRQIEVLAGKTFGIPAAIYWSIDQLKSNLDFEILCRKLEDPEDTIFRGLIEETFQSINIDDTLLQISVLMSLFPDYLTQNMIHDALELPEETAQFAITQLKTYCLIKSIQIGDEKRLLALDAFKDYIRKKISTRIMYQIQIKCLKYYINSVEKINNEKLIQYEKNNIISLLEEQLRNDSIELTQLALETIRFYIGKLEKTSQINDAERISDIAIKLSRKTGNVLQQIDFMLDYYEMTKFLRKEFEKAESLNQEALSLSKREGYAKGQAKAYRNLGGLAKAQGRYQDALDYFEKALANLNDDQEEEIRIVNGLISSAYRKMGEFQKARDILDEEIKTCREDFEGQYVRLSVALCRYGTSFLEEENPESAIGYFLESMTIDEGHGRATSIYYNARKLTRCYIILSDFQKAKEFAEKSYTVALKHKMYDLVPQAQELLSLLNTASEDEIKNRKWEDANE